MNVGGVAGEQDPAVAVGGGLLCAVGPRRCQVQRSQRGVCPRHAAQHRLNVVQGDWGGAVKRAAVELEHGEEAGLGLFIEAGRCQGASRVELVGIGDVDLGHVAGELRVGPDERK